MARMNTVKIMVITVLCVFLVFIVIQLVNYKNKVEKINLLEKISLVIENKLLELKSEKPEITTVMTTRRQLSEIFQCNNQKLIKSVKQKGNFTVLYNYVQASRTFSCEETITYTAPADFRFLNNLISVVDKWKGPVSVALYAPGTDFINTVEVIAYLRNCETSLIKDLVTFHIFFEANHTPDMFSGPLINAYEDNYECERGSPFQILPNDEDLYKSKQYLLYPINVARNIARETVQTHLVFPSDIELYPTPNFIQNFFEMIIKQPNLLTDGNNIFILPVFEVTQNSTVPKNKTGLQQMFKKKEAMWFHAKVCPMCHNIPEKDRWMKEAETDDLDIFTSVKRQGKFRVWEPFYVCTAKEPLFDERLTWEGQSNKITQAYVLCLLDYNFLVLNNAFLVHKPGIKKKKVQYMTSQNIINLTNSFLKKSFLKEMQLLFGNRPNCTIRF